MTDPSLDPLLALTAPAMKHVNRIIVERMESEIDLIPTLAGHLVSAGGKRIRPVLTLAGAMLGEGAGGDGNTARLAAAVEFIHTATLLHDDVIDQSAMRRGRETANAVWGNEASVLVGDFLFARAFELMVEVGDITILGKLATASTRITEGEIHQMLIAGKPDTRSEDYIRVVTGKTAELFAAAAETGAMAGGCGAATVDAMRRYGMALGIAFQIADDALDYRADGDELGKTVGDDFMEGKTTLPVMLAYADGDGEEREFWDRCLGARDIRDGDLERAKSILERRGAVERSLEEARRHADSAEACLAAVAEGAIRDGLAGAARFAANRAR